MITIIKKIFLSLLLTIVEQKRLFPKNENSLLQKPTYKN